MADRNTMHTNKTAGISRTVMTEQTLQERIRFLSAENVSGHDFHNTELSDMVIEGKNLKGAEFHFAKLVRVRFVGMNFENAEFKFSEMEDVEFTGCSMYCSSFDFSTLIGVTFTKCLLARGGFELSGGKIRFSECSLCKANFQMSSAEIVMAHCNAGGAIYSGSPGLKITSENSIFYDAQFNDSTLSGSFRSSLLTNADFAGCNAEKLSFEECAMHGICTEDAVGMGSSAVEEINFEI